jgi:hypothetical protein
MAACQHPTSVAKPLPDWVTGKPEKPGQLSHNSARVSHGDNRCGPQARYWEPPIMSMARLCKDCRSAALEGYEDRMVWLCTHSRSKFVPSPDYVTGKLVTPRQLRCSEARYFDDGYTCGPQGRYWEATITCMLSEWISAAVHEALFRGGPR